MKYLLYSFIILALLAQAYAAIEDPGDLSVGGIEVEKALNLLSGLLAAGLCVTTIVAYRRTKNKRLLYVSVAFALFALKGFLQAHELVMDELAWIDPLASFLNFAILLCFFIGVLKK